MPKFLKYVIVWAFYIVAICLCFTGKGAILGIPLGVIGYALQKQFNVYID